MYRIMLIDKSTDDIISSKIVERDEVAEYINLMLNTLYNVDFLIFDLGEKRN